MGSYGSKIMHSIKLTMRESSGQKLRTECYISKYLRKKGEKNLKEVQ